MAVATPLASPPPPIGTRTTARSGRSSTISSPTVPWPAMIRSSSNGGMIASPRCAAISSATRCRSSLAVPTTTISAPSAATRSRLTAGASDGMTTTAGAPEQARGPSDALGVVARRVGDDAARQLPRASRDATATYAPRSLNAPIGWSDSALR